MILARSGWAAMREKLADLFLASFNRPIQQEYIDWRYCNNGQEQLLFNVEMANDVPVASYSAFPVTLARNSEKYQTAMSMTTMTHPDWRGKGLFQRLATELYDHMTSLRTAAVWGFPNVNSHSAFIGKLGWSDIYEIPTMTLNISTIAQHKLTFSSSVERDDNFSLLYLEPPKDGLIRVYRTNDYLKWRYAENPINKYHNYVLATDGTVTSYIVTKDFGNGLDLVDIQTSTKEEALVLLSHILKLGYERNLSQASCWAPTHHSVHGVLERLGFMNAAPITYFGGRELTLSSVPKDWSNYKNWYVQMGDSDVF